MPSGILPRMTQHDRFAALDPASVAISAGRGAGRPGDPLNVPPVAASTFVLGGAHGYARDDATPTVEALEIVLGALEHGLAVAFSSGMAAMAAVIDRVPAGGRLAIPSVCYQGTTALARRFARMRGATLIEVDQQETPRWIDALRTCDVVVVESPNNPMLRIADLVEIGGALDGRRALLAVDSTLATPMIQQPLELGADVVIHSATKAIGGHSDLLLGAAVTADPAVASELRTHRTLYGAVPGAFETFLATRGVRTLPLRFERAQDNALGLAVRLEAHPMVSTVHHPGLRTHPDHARAAGQMRGFGSMVSFELHGDARQADAVCAQLRLIVHATSLGGVESTIERRAAVPGQQHLPPSLLRLSVGCEHVDDLWADLAAALDGAARTRPAPSAD